MSLLIYCLEVFVMPRIYRGFRGPTVRYVFLTGIANDLFDV